MRYRREEAKQAARESFHGVWAALTTPFTESGQLDEAGLRSNMQYLTGDLLIDGVFCTGVMGEFWSLTREEWMRAIEIVVEEARDRCLVIAHTGHHSVDETVGLTRHAEDVGADFAIMITPYYPPRSEGGVFRWFEEVCRQVNIGIWMFDGMYSGAGGMSPELAARIAELDNICGMKQAWPMDRHDAYHRLLADKIVLSQPSEPHWLRLMRDYGQQVYMSSPAPYQFQRPGWLPLRDYTTLAMQGDFEAAERVSAQLGALRDLDDKWVSCRLSRDGILPIAYLKAWTAALGMASGPVRAPLEPITPEEEAELVDDLHSTELFSSVHTVR